MSESTFWDHLTNGNFDGPSPPNHIREYTVKMWELNRIPRFEYNPENDKWKLVELKFRKGYIGSLPEELRS